ncbi:ABC transporter permease [Selenomonadales bacterium OttesenSCG-928-I06]|nr:ABC transporter permease [Selenomonadales bacterium OttesenSCG-928-I06]
MLEKRTFYGYISAIIILFAIWHLVAVILDLPIIPQPFMVLDNLTAIFIDEIAIHGLYSIWRIIAGVFLAIIVGVPIGVLMGYFDKFDRFLAPIIYLTYPIPKIALLPILMLLCGLGEMSKIIMIFLIIVFQVVVSVRDGIRSIPKEIYYPLYSLGANFMDIFKEVLFNASMPNFLTSIRIALATSISVLFFTETFGSQYGMGYFIMDAWLRVNYLEMYSGIIVLSFIGLILFVFTDFLEKKICRWQYK